MREEIEHWWKQALNDFKKAEVLFVSKNYDGVAFYCQQTTEKALKSVILLLTKQKAVGHSLYYLGKEAKIPSSYFSELKRLSPQYFLSRYPDASEEIPYELYDEKIAAEFIQIAKRVLEWTEKQFK